MAVCRRVVVTGIGVVCPLGWSAAEAWKGVLEGESGLTAISGPEFDRLPCRVVAPVPDRRARIEGLFSKTALNSLSTATALGLVAAAEALDDAAWTPADAPSRERTGVAFGIAMMDLADVSAGGAALETAYKRLSPFFIPRILPNMAAGQISIKYGLRGPNHCASTACATGAHSIGDGFRFVKHGDADVMLCGGAESCVSPLAIAGFSRLRALATSFNGSPTEASRPFDRRREGFVIGEGAAALVLEERDHAVRRGAKMYAEVLGYGLSGDASHITAPREDGSGAVLSMRRALEEARVEPGRVGYVNAHATSTPLGDAAESRAISALFKDVHVSSTKGAHGHLLGAAGNLESVFAVLSCHEGKIPPTLNLEDAGDVTPLNYVANVQRAWDADSRRIALKNSFGFGGTNASLCFAQID